MSLTLGSEYVFNNNGYTPGTSCVLINTNKIVVCYKDNTTSQGMAVVGTISGFVITWGTPQAFNAANTGSISCAAIDSDKYVVCFQDSGDSNLGKSMVATVSGTVSTFGSEQDFNSGSTVVFTSCAKLDTNKYVIAYRDNGGTQYAHTVVATVSGTVSTFGTKQAVNATVIQDVKCCELGTDKYAVIYRHGTSSGRTTVATVLGTVSTFGTEATFNSTNAEDLGCTEIDTDKYVICFRDTADGSLGKTIVCTVSGTTITPGTEQTFNSPSQSYNLCVAKMATDKYAVCFRDSSDGNNGNSLLATVSGTVSTFDTEETFNADLTYWVSCCPVRSNGFAVCFQDNGNSGYGTSVIGSDASVPTVTTQAVSAITSTTATGNGNITDIGGSPVTRRGFAYMEGTSGDPDITDSTVFDDGTFGTGAYTKGIVGLAPGTPYRVRAYAVNGEGISYGSTVQMETLHAPIVTTQAVTSITDVTATGNGTITDIGGATVTRRGFAYMEGVSGDPDITDSVAFDDGSFGVGAYTKGLTGLTGGTDYRVRAYAVNSEGVGYGTTVQLTTLKTDFTNPANAYADDAAYATAPGDNGDIYVSLSKDGGSNYTSELNVTVTGSETVETFGDGDTELWGTAFTGDDVDDTSFRLKIRCGTVTTTYQIYKDFGFALASSQILSGVEVAVKAKWDGATTSINHIKVKVHYGTSTLPIQPGSVAYASDGRKAGEGVGSGTGVQVFRDGASTWIAVDTGLAVAA